jgi:hypothetical protein
MHPSTDKLVGTDVYGIPFNDKDPWSVKFQDTHYDQYMFTSGDFTRWLVCTKIAILEWYSNTNRPILKSSRSSTPTVNKWWRRVTGYLEDPWVTLGDWNDSDKEVLYGGVSYPNYW